MTSADSPIYRDLMRFKPEGLTANAWAVSAGVSRTVWTDMRRHGNPSRRTLEKLLAAAGSSLAEFEALRIGQDAAVADVGIGALADPVLRWRQMVSAPVPVIASRAAGPIDIDGTLIEATELDGAQIIALLPRPAALDADRKAYAFTMASRSMWPRFRQGRHVAVSPAAEVVAGDDVVVTMRKESATGIMLVVLGELVDADRVQLRQFNPDTVFSIEPERVVTLHKIAGELI